MGSVGSLGGREGVERAGGVSSSIQDQDKCAQNLSSISVCVCVHAICLYRLCIGGTGLYSNTVTAYVAIRYRTGS